MRGPPDDTETRRAIGRYIRGCLRLVQSVQFPPKQTVAPLILFHLTAVWNSGPLCLQHHRLCRTLPAGTLPSTTVRLE